MGRCFFNLNVTMSRHLMEAVMQSLNMYNVFNVCKAKITYYMLFHLDNIYAYGIYLWIYVFLIAWKFLWYRVKASMIMEQLIRGAGMSTVTNCRYLVMDRLPNLAHLMLYNLNNFSVFWLFSFVVLLTHRYVQNDVLSFSLFIFLII